MADKVQVKDKLFCRYYGF